MNSIKSIVATVVLLGVGYGANFFMHQPAGTMDTDDAWGEISKLGSNNSGGPPNLTLPPLQPAAEAIGNAGPFARSGSTNPFANGQDPSVSIPSTLPTSTSPASTSLIPDLPPADHLTQEAAGVTTPNIETSPASPAPEAFVPPPSTMPMAAADVSSIQNAINPPRSQFPVNEVTPATHVQPVQTTDSADFDRLWNEAQSLLSSGDLSNASMTLTRLYRQTPSDEDRGRVVTILDQLAGTAIYSGEHFLLPAHNVQPNEQLSTIAQTYQVPIRFLELANGLAENATVSAGKQLKVVRGPFHAELDLSSREMTVYLGEHYAGRFDVAVGRDFPQGVTSFSVTEKTGSRDYQDSRTGQIIAAGDAANPIGDFWIGLQAFPTVAQSNIGVHSVGEGITAADSRGCISVSRDDAADLQAILSIGSQISVRRGR